MSRKMRRDLLEVAQQQADQGVRHRVGVVTAVSPLSVDLGNSGTAYTSVKALGSYVATVGDVVSVVRFGTDLLVLGKIGSGGPSPHCEITRVATAQAIPNGVVTAISWDTAIENSSGMWSAGAPTIVTISRTGRYMVEANVEWAPEPTAGPHGLWIQPSTTSNAAPRDVGQYETVAAGFQHLPSAGAPMFLPNGTTLTVFVYKVTGAGALNCGGPPATLFGMGTNLRVSWLGE